MLLIPHRSGRREEKAAGDHCRDEGEAEEQEGMPVQVAAVPGAEGVGAEGADAACGGKGDAGEGTVAVAEG